MRWLPGIVSFIMPSPKGKKGEKGDISKDNLERHGIIYDEKVYTRNQEDPKASDSQDSNLPDHVDALREALLAFAGIIPEDWKEIFDDEFEQYGRVIDEKEYLLPPAEAYFTPLRYELRNPTPRSTAAHENNERCEKIAIAARKRAKEAEAGWTHFLRKKIFRDFDEEKNSRTEIE